MTDARRETRRHVDAVARAGGPRAAALRARASSRCSTRSAPARRRSRSAASGRRRRARAHHPRRRRGDRARSARPSPATCSACAARSATTWPVDAGRGRDVVIVAGGIGLAPLRPVVRALLARRGRYGRVRCSTAGARPRSCSSRDELAAWAAAPTSRVEVTVERADGRLGRARSGSSRSSSRARASTPARTVAMICGPEVMMRFAAAALRDRGVAAERDLACRWSAAWRAAIGHCGHCQLGPLLLCRDGPVFRYDVVEPLAAGARSCERRPTLAVWKFASCDGCQLSLLDCEDELLDARRRLDDRLLPGGRPRRDVRERYDLSIVEGSITTPDDAERIRDVRARSRRLITIGACANAGGIQALRNFADVDELRRARLRRPRTTSSTLRDSTPVSAHVAGRLRAAGLPARQAPAPGGHLGLPARPPPARSPRTACASSASAAATSASWSPTARRAWAR